MSVEYDDLEIAIGELRSGLMSFGQREDGEYTLEERLKCKAFIVFSHAELENYLEKVARRIMNEAKSRWEATRIPDRVIATLLAYRRKEVTLPPENPRIPVGRADLSEIVKQCFSLQRAAIDDNNGIKSKNFSQLLCPLGVLSEDIEEPLLIQLDDMGKRRGDFAHKTNKVSMPHLRDPISDELSDVSNLMIEIKNFDNSLENLNLLSL